MPSFIPGYVVYKPYTEVNTMAFANKLTEIRKIRNLTQQELAEKVGVGISQMRRYEKGSSSPTLEVIKNLAITLGVSTDELIFESNERVAASRILDKELLRQFETVSGLTARDIDAIKTVLESIIIKNRIEEILPGQTKEGSWEEDMRQVQKKFRKKASNYSEQEIEDIVDEAVAAVRSEGKSPKSGRPIGA
jgi:transcriptional regulator with XRE-family HTH domain